MISWLAVGPGACWWCRRRDRGPPSGGARPERM